MRTDSNSKSRTLAAVSEGRKKKKEDRMSGYDGWTMSNNAREAYGKGLRPISKITASDLEEAGIKMSLKALRSLIRHGVIRRAEWHHTSDRFNRTDFYDLSEVAAAEAAGDYKDSLGAISAEEKNKNNDVGEYLARVKYLEWSGTRSHPRASERIAVATIRGNWAYFYDGHKKSVDSRGFEILEKL